MRAWQFSKPKGPGFGISATFYLTVLSSHPTLPSLLQILSPEGGNGVVEGLGAPLEGAGDKAALAQPLSRGSYALASKDRKTVIKMVVLSKDESGFDPELLAESALGASLEPEIVNRVRATWTVLQLAFQSHDPAVYPAVDFLLRICRRLAELTDGVVADSISQRYLLPTKVFHSPEAVEKIDVRDVVAVSYRNRPDGVHLFSLGMQKFGLPEYEIYGCEDHARLLGSAFLLGLCQAALLGKGAFIGAKVGSATIPFEVREGALDRALWGEVRCIELLPPTANTASEALIAWADEAGAS